MMTALERKRKTEAYLTSLNIPFIDHLPVIEEENEAKIRTSQEVAKRILILTYLCYTAEVPDQKFKVIEFLEKTKLWDDTSEFEKILFQKDLSDKEKYTISWRSEATWLLLWALNKVDNLELPIEEISVSKIVDRIPEFMEDVSEFVKNAKLRSVSELLDMSDLIYRLHWASRHCEEYDETIKINSDIIFERHYAINWLTYYGDNWDDIATDT